LEDMRNRSLATTDLRLSGSLYDVPWPIGRLAVQSARCARAQAVQQSQHCLGRGCALLRALGLRQTVPLYGLHRLQASDQQFVPSACGHRFERED
jgi:hypothetical protein